jgi:hypothetical protein
MGLLIFLSGINHIVLDFHRFWKVNRGELEQALDTPETD